MDTLSGQLTAKLDNGSWIGVAQKLQEHLQLVGITAGNFLQQVEYLRISRAIPKRLGYILISQIQEVRQQLHFLALSLQRGVIAVELGHFRCQVADNALNYIQRDSVKSGEVAEGMTATVEVFDRDGAIASGRFAGGDDMAFVFQKSLDTVA